MSKIAFIFPGQGAQYVGMGKDFYDTYEEAKAVYRKAGEVTGLNMEELCFTENENLNITKYTQIAMLATEVALLKVLESKGVHADVCAGLSLGEYGALAAAGVMDLDSLFHIIRQRGIYMQEAYPVGGVMTAVLGLDAAVIEEVLKQIDGLVSIANYNCPGQIVITGEAKAVEAAGAALQTAGAKRCIPLKVSGPFHSQMLKGAGEKLGVELENVEFNDPEIPYLNNVAAEIVTTKDSIKETLERQVYSPVRWEQCVNKMIEEGVDLFYEIGPGKTLAGFMKRIDRSKKVITINTVEDLEGVN